MLQYRNTPDRDTGLSPAQMTFGRPIMDFIPILPGSYRPHNTWIETSRGREEAMRARNVRNTERLTEQSWRPGLYPGSYKHHNTWIKTLRAREEAMRARNVRNTERLTEQSWRPGLYPEPDR